jgi:hypothetical protein
MYFLKSTVHINQFSLTHIYIIDCEQKFSTYIEDLLQMELSWFQLALDKKDFLYLSKYMASHPRKQQPLYSMLWGTQMLRKRVESVVILRHECAVNTELCALYNCL